MKRYLLFAGQDCDYQLGGMGDFAGSFDNLEDAIEAGKITTDKSLENPDDIERTQDWFHILDLQEARVIFDGDSGLDDEQHVNWRLRNNVNVKERAPLIARFMHKGEPL